MAASAAFAATRSGDGYTWGFAGCTLIDGTGRPPVGDAVMLVSGPRVEAGKRAELLLADGDPLKDIACLQDPGSIAYVVKGGKQH